MASEAEGEQVGAKRRKYPRSLHVHTIKVSGEGEKREEGRGERGERGAKSACTMMHSNI